MSQQAIRLHGDLRSQGQRRTKKISKAEFEKKRAHEQEFVRGIFRNFENSGCQITFPYRGGIAIKGDPILHYTLQDSIYYEIPRALARHINENCRYPVHENRLGADGKPHAHIKRWVSRFGFHSVHEDVGDQGNTLISPDTVVMI